MHDPESSASFGNTVWVALENIDKPLHQPSSVLNHRHELPECFRASKTSRLDAQDLEAQFATGLPSNNPCHPDSASFGLVCTGIVILLRSLCENDDRYWTPAEVVFFGQAYGVES
jgi:hypothetical protein